MTKKEIKTRIKIMLLEKDLTITGLALEFGCFRQQLQMCIGGQREYPALRKKLTKKLGVSIDQLFPEGDVSQKQTTKAA